MKTLEEIRTEAARLILLKNQPSEQAVAHIAGRVRALIWVVTGEDVALKPDACNCVSPIDLFHAATKLGIRCKMEKGQFFIDDTGTVGKQK
jgi:hypothetical protein